MRGYTLAAAVLLAAAASSYAQEWRPQRSVEIVVPTGPGSALDQTGRKIQRILQARGLVASSAVVNKPGGGLAVGFAYLNQNAENAHYICITNANLLTNHLTGKDTLSYSDVTPLAQLFSEYVAFTVTTDSAIKSGGDLVGRLRVDPASQTFSVATAFGGANHVATIMMARAAGVDVSKLRTVVFNSSSEGVVNLLGGHLQVVAAPPTVTLPHLRAGKVRVVAVSAPQRLSGDFASVPTWREQGIDVTFASHRGVIGPKGLSAAQIAFWDSVWRTLAKTDEWQADVSANLWAGNYLDSAHMREGMRAQYDELRTVYREAGLIK